MLYWGGNSHISNSIKMSIKNKRAQEEIMGFAMIIILVAVILLVFLGISLNRNKSQNNDTPEVDSFMQAMLQYTTSCQNSFGYVSMKDLIFACVSGNGVSCPNGEDSCSILNSDLGGIMNQSWNVGQGSPIKGYSLNITSNTGKVIQIEYGNKTSNSQGTFQSLSKEGISTQVTLKVYS